MSIPHLLWKFQTHSVNDSIIYDFDRVFLEIPVEELHCGYVVNILYWIIYMYVDTDIHINL